MSLLYYIPVALVTLATLVYYYVTKNFNYWKDMGVVGPTPVPLFGNMKDSALRKKNMAIVFKEIHEAFPNEKIVGVYRMTTPCLLVRDLDIIKHIMIKDFDLFIDRGGVLSKKGLGANLFHSEGDTWRALRNRLTPLFTSGKLKNMLYLMDERGDSFVKYIDELVKQQSEQEAYKLVQKYTVATISACAFGLDVDTQNNQETIQTLKKIDELIFTVSYVGEVEMMFPGFFKRLNLSIFPTFIEKFFFGLVDDIVKQRNGVPSNRKDFMDLILELRQNKEVLSVKKSADDKQYSFEVTDAVMAAQAFVFYAAGYETSATTMVFMLYELAKNPDVQEKLLADIDRVLEKHNGKVTYETLQDMTYLEKVFNETLRKYPLVDSLQRCAKTDYKLPGTDVTIKKGTQILVSAIGIQYDEKYYPNPEKFDPERHTLERIAERHTCAFMPFGVGPRNCIGMRFARVQSSMCMTKFFSKFRVEMSKNTPVDLKYSPWRAVLGPDGGIHMNIIKRK